MQLNRNLLVLVIVAASVLGCESPLVEPQAIPDYRASAAAVLTAEGESAVPDNPDPAPPPAGVCSNCNGTGRLGDGTVSVPCPVCGGDGRTDNELPPVISQETIEQWRKDSEAWRKYQQTQSTPQRAAPVAVQDAVPVAHDAPRRRGPLRRVFGR